MANPEHLEILKQGVEVWNQWRSDYPLIIPDLRRAGFYGARLNKVNFSGAWLNEADLGMANLNGANLNGAHLIEVDLAWSDLSSAVLTYADLYGADLSWAKLNKAVLNDAILSWAKLSDTILREADLSGAHLKGVVLSYADLNQAEIGWTVFGDNDLSTVKGLETVKHSGPSTIGIDTIYKSGGNVPEVFLRGCGVPDDFITYMRSLVAHPIQFYSCFISYSSKNQLFADRLYADLQNKGVRCWLASEDLKIGDKIRIGIDESIRFHDKLLLVLSKHSVASDWVEQEVETALARERKEKRTVLFPIRLDDTVMKIDTGWPALVKNTRNIGDFRKWRSPEAYQKALDRLLRDLKAEEKKP
jgi:uncharacterized protein YjbI with pentapeptide repeats